MCPRRSSTSTRRRSTRSRMAAGRITPSSSSTSRRRLRSPRRSQKRARRSWKRPRPSVADLFQFWFGWVTPVGRRRYFLHGAGLMLFKYLADTAVVWFATGHMWTPAVYFSPLWTVRQQTLGPGSDGLALGLAIWTLPFLWIGVSLTMRRAIDAGSSAWLAILFFIP